MSSGKQSASNKTSSLSTHAEQARKSCSTAEDTSEQLPVVTPGPETQPDATFLTKPNPKELDPQGPQAADFAATSSTEQAETDCIVKQGASEEATDISGISQEDSDDDFNIVQPTLIKQLKKILDQYPDDGQILKELIQNAEDAGASNVKFLCDYHRYGTERLHHPELGKFQGPALYAYNNETFTAKDWKGIKMLSDSIKDKDPMKVGRFGLGFKSVYHITDLPSIVSGTQVGVFDPHQQYFSDNNGERGTGHRWRFEQDRKKMNQIPDQFAPYKGIFGCGKESFSSRYSGTLFRFPLREKPSRLSDNLYSPEKVQKEHFESFQADAHMVLLFLKNLESIELYIRGEEESSPRKTFEVKIADESLENVRAKRKELIDKVRDLKYGEVPSSPVSVTYPLTIECTSYEGLGHSMRHTYILTNYVSGGEIGSCVKQLMEAEELSYLPWVGVAMAVEQLKTAEDPKGHLFCFLPLPVQKKSLTGLPLHVNGFFALSQNRRHLKWPTANQEEEGKELTDKALQWNKFLVKEVVPLAYADLLLHSIKMPREEVPVELFYKAWPDPVKTDPKWLEVLPPLFKQLLKCATFHTPADGGTWLKIKEAIFDTLNEDKETTEVLLNTLRLANKKIVSAPRHVMDVIAEHHCQIASITPKLVQDALRRCHSCYVNCTRSEKLLLLKYVLKDSHFEDLYDLELLPLSNGTFTKFLQKDHPLCASIYIPSQEHAQSLLPGLDHLFLDSAIEKEIFMQLQMAGIPGNPQLQHLDKNAVITLLPKSFPCDWSSGEYVIWYPGNTNEGHPCKEWLESLWRYMSLHFPNDLSKLENQPLIPLNWSGDKVTLARLCSPSVLVLQSTSHGRLDVTVSKVLTNIGITVISELPQFVMSHPAVLGNYIHRPLVSSVLQAMMTLTSASGFGAIVRQLEQQSPSDKRALRVFIAKASTFSDRERDLVRQLPLLETLENSGSRSSRFVAAVDISNAAPRKVLPINVIQEVIDIRHEGSESLARLSRVTMLSATELLCQIVFQDVRELKYTGSDVDKLMKHVFDHFHEYKKEMPGFQLIVKTLPFVTKRNGERVKPSDLFDPTVACVQNILADEDVFPDGPVYTERGTLVILRDLGLKEEKDLTACDVLKSVHHIENVLPPVNARRKALALLEHLNSNIRKMLDTVDGQTLGTWLRELRWVPPMTARRPPSYPESLPFCGLDSAHLLKPTQMKSSKFVDVIGSVKPVVAIKDNRFLTIADFFDWAKAPDTIDVITHLKKVIECYTQTEKPTYMIIVKEIYQQLLNLDFSERTKMLSQLNVQKWIWNGDGFSSPSTIICEKAFIDLSPYICLLPSEVTEFKDIFTAGGMRNESKISSLLQVLELMEEKYDKGQNHTRADVKQDLQLAIAILNELKPFLEDCSEDVKVRLLIPTHVDVDDSTLHLAHIHECTYCDAEWLKQGHDASDIDEDGEVKIMFVHRNIPIDTAETIGVPSLMSRMLDADEFDVGEEFGQEEPLTRSIHRLLEGYTDGFAVPKELIQNADDAGATEVKFMYDERTNEDSMTCLFDKGMEACQGPALWAYNNAVFTDEDFTNIAKLNGATKERDTDKIGRFGSGFNAVYNLTDVPSFISRNSFAIFDPHKTHLGKAVKNGNPGIKINLQKNKQKLRKLANQFKPFNGIFGCDLRPEAGQDSYDGTLFRFPLRTKEQAVKSELKDLHYTDQEMRELLNKLVEGGESLLLFTQTVCQVSIYHLPRGSSGTLHPAKLFEVTKSAARVIRHVTLSFPLPPNVTRMRGPEQYFAKQSSFLRASSHALRTNCPEEFPRSSMVIDVKMKHTKRGAKFLSLKKDRQNSSSWLVSSAIGTALALEYTKKDKTLLPTAGVAVRLLRESPELFIPKPIVDPNDGTKPNGKVFCYLPLPLLSGLPVHVNGFFAVASDRRHLKERTEDDKNCHGNDWNEVLMKDALLEAYISALEDLKSLLSVHQRSCDIYELWPRVEKFPSVCQPLVNSFYNRLSGEGPSFPSLFSDGTMWVNIDQVVFLDPALRRHQEIGNIAFNVFKSFNPYGKVVVDLPHGIMESFRLCGHEGAIKKRTFSIERFYREIFAPNITHIPSVDRDPLVLYAVDDDNLKALLNEFPCIPSSPEGKKLKCPQELVHPTGRASFLYSPEDGMFPHGTKKIFLSTTRLEKLTQLGMWKDRLSWEAVIERAKSVQTLNQSDHRGARKRAKALIRFLNKTLTAEDNLLPSPDIRENLMKAEFLPVLQKTKKFPLSWKGDVYGPQALLAPKDVFLERYKNLVSCTRPILDDSSDGCGQLTGETTAFLGFQEKSVCLDDVKAQLETAITSTIELQNADNHKAMEELLYSVYKYLQVHLDQKREQIIPFLDGKNFILGKTHLLNAKQVAFESQVDSPPYLYKLPRDLDLKFSKLMSEAGVRQFFDGEDYHETLRLIKKRFRDNVLDDESVKLTVDLANLVDSCSKGGNLPLNSDLYLPDTCKRLYPSSELCIKDCYWMPDEEGVKYIHERIPPQTCINLGVNTRRRETLRKCSEGIPFGQHEKLTTRIKRILTVYPCEDGLLKELLQNADDAQATELCFIKDPRQHGVQRVFEDSWKPLQGPALCVFNNKPFTKADIVGIQNLGEGSKGDDPNKTGQYGVGFNAVYHLTDAPSFLSKGSEIGEVLCVFDPQCKFVPGATSHEPGQMFRDIDRLRGAFTDVFPCYLGEHFPVDDSTMFRFPLRSSKMAQESNICKNPMTVEGLEVMMKKFKSEIFDALLFVNSVRKITLCEVARNGDLANHYEVTAKLSEDDARKRSAFSNYVTNVGSQLRKKELNLCQVLMKEVSYAVDLVDNKGYCEKWLVIQRIGFESEMVVSKRLLGAFAAGDLTLLPRGGVASLLQQSPSSHQVRKPMKAFCFLPLPFETGLPVHINGHFALDHEARRGLWRDDDGGYRSDWNNSLLCGVIAPCYVSLLATVREHAQLPVDDNGVTLLECKDSVACNRIATYLGLFPSCCLEETYWGTLSRGVYQYVHKNGARLLPVLRTLPSHVPTYCVSEITWLSPNDQGKDKAFFNNLEANPSIHRPSFYPSTHPSIADSRSSYLLKCKQNERLKHILMSAGFNLIEAPLSLYHNFVASDAPVDCLSPRAVLDFFRSYSSLQPLCRLGKLPMSIQDTPFGDVNSVVLLLKYCKEDKSFMECLQGLPLLVTQDSTLRVFDRSSSAFLTDHLDVLPQCASEFVHHSLFCAIFYEADLDKCAVFKVFDVESLARNLHRNIPASEFCTGNRYVHWNTRDGQGIPCGSWIMQVWKFLAKETKSILQSNVLDSSGKRAEKPFAMKRKDLAAKLGPLNDWCLLPATETDFDRHHIGTPARHYLVPVSLADTILAFDDTYVASPLKEALRTLSLPELNCTVIDGSRFLCGYSKPAKMLVATLSNPTLVLRVLSQKLKCSSMKMSVLKCERILLYFSENVQSLGGEDADILRMLPFYLTAHGDLTDLMCGKVYVLPETVPKEGMNVWKSKKETVFLKENLSLSTLHAFLGGTSFSEIDFYCNYIFEHFEDLKMNDQHVHLEYLRKSKLPVLEEPDRSRLLACLRDLRFIPAQDGSLQTASFFYDPEQPIFRELLHQDSFPPSPFSCPYKWLPFLREIGLVKEVSTKHFVEFAQQVAVEARMSRNERIQAKSLALLENLFQRPNVATEGLLEQIRQIPFVHPCEVSERLSGVYPQFGLAQKDELPYICFEGSVLNSHESIAWTSASLLPRTADPTHHPGHLFNINYSKSPLQHSKNYRDETIRRLGILKEPTIEHVVSHCENVCFQWDKGNNSSYKVKREIIVAIYRFLWRHRDHIKESRLQHVPCILVEKGHFTLPCQIVVEFMGDLEIKPYLFKAPTEFGEFHGLFLALGATQVVTVEQYAMVLIQIHKDAVDAKLEPNELKKSFRAVKGMFGMLEKASVKEIAVPIMFLPGAKREDPTRVFMRSSTKLVFDDAPHLRNRIKEFEEMVLVDLKQCDLQATNFGSLVKMLPDRFRPQMLTSLVQESLSKPANELFLQGSAEDLRHLLTSQQFSHAIVRLIRHEDSKAGKKTGTEILASVKQCLSGIRVHGIQALKTHLLYKGKIIPESEIDQTCFAEKVGQVWNVYLETSGGHEKTWICKVAEIVNEITGGLLVNNALMFLPQLLNCTPREIWPLLDDLKILEDRSSDLDQTLSLPQPGTFIHIEDHHLLKDAFEDFEPGEFVGYELNDTGMESVDDTPTYVYAVIIEEAQPEFAHTVSFLKKYKIEVGNEKDPIVVDAVDLYKFRRVKGAPCWDMVPYEGDEAAHSGFAPQAQLKNLEEAMDEITELLEEAWKLPEEKRDKIIKRLYLTWHPDKNPGNEEFCTKVFQYLQEEIQRIERGDPRRPRGETSTPKFNPDYSNSGFSTSFGRWNNRAQTHRRQYNHFQEDHGSSGFRSHRANPQPPEARRWFRQAKADFEAASNDLSGAKPSHEWVCFKCHQAAEKALKAAQYSKDANKTNQHNLSLNASSLGNAELSRLASDLEGLLGDSTRMRYPDRTRFPNIPHDVYNREMAIQAQDYAEQILAVAKRYIDSRI